MDGYQYVGPSRRVLRGVLGPLKKYENTPMTVYKRKRFLLRDSDV